MGTAVKAARAQLQGTHDVLAMAVRKPFFTCLPSVRMFGPGALLRVFII